MVFSENSVLMAIFKSQVEEQNFKKGKSETRES